MASAFLVGIFLICLIMLLSLGGAWDNLIIWFGVVMSGLLATNYFEPLATWLDSSVSSNYTWMWDIIAFWLIFTASIGIFRMATDQLSKVRVRFRMPVEWGGKVIFGVLAAWTMVCLTAFSMHLAPTSRHSWNESFMEKANDTALLSADYLWMSFAHKVSHPESSLFGSDAAHQFDPEGIFAKKYGLRRHRYEFLNGQAGKMIEP